MKKIHGMKWRYVFAFMDVVERFGETSYAKRLKVGAMIVKNDSIISIGVNGQPAGWHTEICEQDDVTLPTVRHAEVAALEKLINSTETAAGSVMFVSHAPCVDCAIKIVSAGIHAVFYRSEYRSLEGLEYLKSRGVSVVRVD